MGSCKRMVQVPFNFRTKKACKRCFFCKSVFICSKCSKCPSCCSTSSCGRSTSQVLANVGCSGFQPENCIHSEGGLYLYTLPDQTTSVQISSYPQWVCQSSQEQLPERGIGYPCDQKAVQMVEVQSSLGLYNRLFRVPKPNNHWCPILDLSTLNTFLKVKTFKMETRTE